MRTALLRLIVVMLLVWGAGRAAAADKAASRPDSGKDPATEVIIDKQTKDTVAKELWSRIDRVLKGLPDGWRIRVVIEQAFNTNDATTYKYISSVAPVNAQDVLDGNEYVFRPSASGPSQIVPWKSGLKDGVEKAYARAGDDWTLVLKSETTWSGGKMHGPQTTYYPNGKTKTVVNYVGGLAEGESTTVAEDGKVTRKTNMKAGKRHGPTTDYWPNGSVKQAVPYDMGKVSGPVKEFYEDGKIKHELPFKDNKEHGIEKTYGPDGAVTLTRYWVSGESVAKGVFDAKFKP